MRACQREGRDPFRRVPLAVLVLTLVSCCTEKAADGWRGTVDTLQGGTLVVSNPAEGVWQTSSPWRLIEEVKIGTRSGGGPEAFGDIIDLDVDQLGRIYVLDRLAQEVRVFGADGSYVRTIGRPGSGPGELRAANGMGFDPAGRLWVQNPGNVRYSVFDTSGACLKEPQRLQGGVRFADWYGVFDRSGALYDVLFYVSPAGNRTFAYARYDTTTGAFVDTLPGVGFPKAPLFMGVRLATQDGFWLAAANEYRLSHTTFAGDTSMVIGRRFDRIRGSASGGDSVAPRGPSPQGSQRGLPDSVRRSLQRADDERILLGLMEDEQRYLWVMLAVPGATRTYLDVFDSNGRYLGLIVAPHRFERRPLPLVRNNRVYAVIKDDLDLSYVVTLSIEGRD